MKGHDKVNQKIVSTIWRSLGSFERCGSPNRKRKFLHPTASAVALFCRLNSEKNHPFSKKPPEDTNTAPLSEGDFFCPQRKRKRQWTDVFAAETGKLHKKANKFVLEKLLFHLVISLV